MIALRFRNWSLVPCVLELFMVRITNWWKKCWKLAFVKLLSLSFQETQCRVTYMLRIWHGLLFQQLSISRYILNNNNKAYFYAHLHWLERSLTDEKRFGRWRSILFERRHSGLFPFSPLERRTSGNRLQVVKGADRSILDYIYGLLDITFIIHDSHIL